MEEKKRRENKMRKNCNNEGKILEKWGIYVIWKKLREKKDGRPKKITCIYCGYNIQYTHVPREKDGEK